MATIDRRGVTVGEATSAASLYAHSGVAMKAAVKVATTAAITLSGTQTIDGVAVVADDRVLVKDQADSSENGIYLVSTGDWSRSTDMDGAGEIAYGTSVFVVSGTTNGETFWYVSSANPLTIGTSDIEWSKAAVGAADVSIEDSGALITATTVEGALAENRTAIDALEAGRVAGPSSATDNAIVRYDATTGKLVQNSGVTIDDDNDISGIGGTVNTGNGVSTGDAAIQLGALRTGDGNAYIDFVAESGADFNWRAIRLGGENGVGGFYHTGTGNMVFQAVDAAAMLFQTNGSNTGISISSAQAVAFPGISTTAVAANAYLDSGASNNLLRSTSSRVYKRDVEDLDIAYAYRAMGLRPVWYRSKADRDNPDHSHWGFIAEEAAEIDPRLVQFGYHQGDYETVEIELGKVDGKRAIDRQRRVKEGAKLKPDGFAYERLSVLHHAVINDLIERIEALESKIKDTS